jgi:hypothetical protein
VYLNAEREIFYLLSQHRWAPPVLAPLALQQRKSPACSELSRMQEICAGTAQEDTAKAEDVCHVTIGALRSLAAVFDGHGGKRAAQLCEQELVPTLLSAGLGSCLTGIRELSSEESPAHEIPGRAAAGWGAQQRVVADGGAAAGWGATARIAEVQVELQSSSEGDANGGAAVKSNPDCPMHQA